jgi:integrase
VPLTDIQVRKAEARAKSYKLADAGGLYLFVTPAGFKSWRMKYRIGKTERCITFGPYPEVTLLKAREKRDRARKSIRDNLDPALEQRKRKLAAVAAAGIKFETVAREWHEAQRARWSPVQSMKVIQAFVRDVFPKIGSFPIKDIDGPMVLAMLRKVEDRGAIDSAKRIRQHVSAVFGYAMAEGLVKVDPAAGIGRALKPIGKKGRQPALKSLDDAKILLRDMELTTAGPYVKLASRLLALTAVRPGIVRSAKWQEFEGIDWENPDDLASQAIWRISSERMKLELENKDDDAFEHIVPLSFQAVDVLRAVRRLSGKIEFLFPGTRSIHTCMSENTISYMYCRNGYSGRHVPHGWRSTFSTIMNERAALQRRFEDRAIIDSMLAHKPKGISASEMAYNRAAHMWRRRELAQEWADLIMADLCPASYLLNGQVR